MFNVVAEQFAALQKANLEQAAKASAFAFTNVERAFQWNVGVAKQLASGFIADARSVAEIKDAQGVASLARMNEGKAEQYAELGRAAYDQVTRVQAETVKFVEGSAAELNAAYVKFVDSVVKAAPVGGDQLSSQFKQVWAAQQAAAEQATQQFKQAVSAAETQFKGAVQTANTVAKKARK